MIFSPERKAKAIYFIGRNLLERRKSSVKLEYREGATLDSARRIDQEEGNFLESANHYFSVNSSSVTPTEKADSLIGLSQQLINLGIFRQARLLLESEPPLLLATLGEKNRLVFQARTKEKQGWIADCELGYFQAKECFTQAGELISRLPQDRTNQEQELYSTTRHFLGRALYGLAYLGVDQKENIARAVTYFEEAINLDGQIDSKHKNAKIGFGYGWLLKCYLLTKNMSKVYESLEQARKYFSLQQEETPGRKGVLAHLLLLEGAANLAEQKLQEAQIKFSEAIIIRREEEPYAKGLADAYLGMAVVCWRKRKPLAAVAYLNKVIKTHPYSLVKASFGG